MRIESIRLYFTYFIFMTFAQISLADDEFGAVIRNNSRPNVSTTPNSNNRGPASNSQPSQHFLCSINNSSTMCDSSGRPLTGSGFSLSGDASRMSRPQLIQNCMAANANDSGDDLSTLCAKQVDANYTPPNAIPASNAPGTAERNGRFDGPEMCEEPDGTVAPCNGVPKDMDEQGNAKARNGSCQTGYRRSADSMGCEPDSQANKNAETDSPAVNQAAICELAHSTASTECDTTRQSWMKNIQMAAQGLGPVLESGTCGKLAATNVGASTSLATFKVMCNTATQACLTECKKSNPADPGEQTSMANLAKECKAKGTKAAEAEQAAAQGTQQLMAAVATCKSTFGVNANPFDIKNDPYKGQTAEEIMAGLQPAGGAPLEYSGKSGSGAGTTGNSNFDLSGLEQDAETGKPRAGAKSAAGAPGGSMGSAGLGGGGGSGVDGGGGGTGGKRPSGGLLSNILSGFFGGGGGGSSLFGGTGRSKGGGLSSFFGGENPQEAKTPDLRQFMPGGKMDPRKTRGLAGQRLNADGMSGPHGNIWRMINNRYQYKKASLLP